MSRSFVELHLRDDIDIDREVLAVLKRFPRKEQAHVILQHMVLGLIILENEFKDVSKKSDEMQQILACVSSSLCRRPGCSEGIHSYIKARIRMNAPDQTAASSPKPKKGERTAKASDERPVNDSSIHLTPSARVVEPPPPKPVPSVQTDDDSDEIDWSAMPLAAIAGR